MTFLMFTLTYIVGFLVGWYASAWVAKKSMEDLLDDFSLTKSENVLLKSKLSRWGKRKNV